MNILRRNRLSALVVLTVACAMVAGVSRRATAQDKGSAGPDDKAAVQPTKAKAGPGGTASTPSRAINRSKLSAPT